MSYTYHGATDLITLPNRTVQTFPSGLVRVERSFVCRKTQVARYRNTLKVNEPMPFDDGAPAIDGLYIFPEPQEIVRDDGFVEFRVTAYGRTNIFSEIAIQKSSVAGVYIYRIITPAVNQTFQLDSINEVYIFRGVLESSAPITDLIERPNIENPIVIPVSSGVPLVAGITSRVDNQFPESNPVRLTTTSIRLDSFSSSNFGRWTEYSVSWQATGNVLDSFQFFIDSLQ